MVKFEYNSTYHTLTKMLGNKRGSSISVSPHELDQMICDLQQVKQQLVKQGLV